MPGTPRDQQSPSVYDRGVYAISVAAHLVGSAPQNLRLYEARGLVDPARTAGGTRLYSEADLDRIREIGRLLGAGLNLAGIETVLALRADNRALQDDNRALRADLDNALGAAETRRARHTSTEPSALPESG